MGSMGRVFGGQVVWAFVLLRCAACDVLHVHSGTALLCGDYISEGTMMV